MIHISSDKSLSQLTNVQKQDIQPNAVDLRLDKVYMIKNLPFILDEDQKVHRDSIEIQPNKDGYFELDVGTYEVLMSNIITVGEGEAGFVITRSTLNRNGVYITSGLYDSGYNGVMAGALHVTSGPFKVKVNTRIGQFLLFKAESLHLYDGDYGLNKDHDKKYQAQE
jgi:deoxycytidine triphosphate deaminase